MKPFSLDTVLDYRKSLEDKAKNAFIKARNEEADIEEKIRQTTHNYQKLIEEKEEIQKRDCSILDIIRCEEKITYIKQQLKELNTTLTIRRKALQKEHKYLVQRSRERKVLENLKEKQDSEWRSYINKKEAAVLDEIALLRKQKK